MQGGNDTETEPAADSIDQHLDSHAQAPTGEIGHFDPHGDGAHLDIAADAKDDAVVTWEASEYIHHQKGTEWYLGFAGVLILAGALLFLLLKDVFSVVVLALMGVAVGIYAGRQPQVQRYSVSHRGLSIGDRHYSLEDFRNFSLVDDGSFQSIMLMPLKRLMPPVSIYFSPQDGAKIVDILGSVLPHEDHQPDLIDRLLRKVRF